MGLRRRHRNDARRSGRGHPRLRLLPDVHAPRGGTLFTSFLIDDFLEENAFFGAETVVVSSASSKTAIGTAFHLEQRKAIGVVGLTSARNIDFVRGLGVYDRVVPYDEIDGLGEGRTAYVDIAGDAAVRATVHRVFGDRLTQRMIVGAGPEAVEHAYLELLEARGDPAVGQVLSMWQERGG